MNTLVEPAYAKLNLSLDVLKKREDGYHDMEMIFQLISIHDTVAISFSQIPGIRISCSSRILPENKDNIAYRCAELFLAEAGLSQWGAEIQLEKHIPVCAGMGGGSADGAAVLRAMNRYFGNPLEMRQLLKIAADAGSDIPFCLVGGTSIATGKGERLEQLPDLTHCEFVVVKPSFSVSTPELFQKLDNKRVMLHPDTKGLAAAILDNNLIEMGRRFFNIFEDVLPHGFETIENIKGSLLDCGALGTAMTGTGSAVFGLFPDDGTAEKAIRRFKGKWTFCEAAKPCPRFFTLSDLDIK